MSPCADHGFAVDPPGGSWDVEAPTGRVTADVFANWVRIEEFGRIETITGGLIEGMMDNDNLGIRRGLGTREHVAFEVNAWRSESKPPPNRLRLRAYDPDPALEPPIRHAH